MSIHGLEGTLRRARIFVSDLRLAARVGVNPGERGAEQPIVVDVEVEMGDLGVPARTEQLADTVDYVAVARSVRRVVDRRHYPLVETLATECGREVLTLAGVERVRLRLHKLGCLKRASAAGVEVELARGAGADLPRPEPLPAPDTREAVVVVGGGAAGFSAALWCWRLGHPALLLEPRARLGGQLYMVHGAMPDLPGLDAMDGPSLVRLLERQFVAHGGRWLRAGLTRIVAEEEGMQLTIEPAGQDEPSRLLASTVILATGSRRRALGVPGERELRGRGLLYTAARGASEQAGRRVLVVGGGDSACENALILRRAGAEVMLAYRGERPSARRQFAREVQGREGITLLPQTEVTAFLGGRRLREVQLLERDVGQRQISVDAALVRIGWHPNSEVLPPQWLDGQGFVKREGEVSVAGAPGVFVAGELGGPISSSVAAAFGSGASAAQAATRFLER